jgi:hypothetical protein
LRQDHPQVLAREQHCHLVTRKWITACGEQSTWARISPRYSVPQREDLKQYARGPQGCAFSLESWWGSRPQGGVFAGLTFWWDASCDMKRFPDTQQVRLFSTGLRKRWEFVLIFACLTTRMCADCRGGGGCAARERGPSQARHHCAGRRQGDFKFPAQAPWAGEVPHRAIFEGDCRMFPSPAPCPQSTYLLLQSLPLSR